MCAGDVGAGPLSGLFSILHKLKLVWPHNSNNRAINQSNSQLPLPLLQPPTSHSHQKWSSHQNGMAKSVIDTVLKIRTVSKRIHCVAGAQNQKVCAIIGEDGNVQQQTATLVLEHSKNMRVNMPFSTLFPFLPQFLVHRFQLRESWSFFCCSTFQLIKHRRLFSYWISSLICHTTIFIAMENGFLCAKWEKKNCLCETTCEWVESHWFIHIINNKLAWIW